MHPRERQRPASLRRTLTLYLGALLAVFAVALLFAARDYGQRAANRSYDHLLVSSALSIADSVALVDGQWQVDLPYAALDLLAMAPEDRVFYRVADSRGALITGYGDLPPVPRSINGHGDAPALFDAPYSGETVRFVVVARNLSSPSAQGEVQVQVGQTRRAREALAQEMVNRALLAITVLSLLSLALVGVGVHRAFRPLVRVERELSRREPSDLRPLDAHVPREMDQMVAALNRFMGRLSSSNETLRSFMAEAAHQMRTPLAALRAQAQLALDDEEPEDMRRSLLAIERNASHMSRLLNQLLSDASVIHRANLQRYAPVDLAETVHQALHEAVPQVEPIPRVHLAMSTGPVWVQGDALLLREAIKNLIDNAIKYSGAAPLQVALTLDGDTALLTIADHGPGIAPGDAERVFERFARGEGAAAGGAGLGLAIVKRVVDAHAGRIDLSNRREGGLVATIALPRSHA
ncbi:histidine kinase [Stenotrophomonas chelatiphaga]|jgi:two-component system, OmpR family, sensor histidine kinase TctE|uniref:histidine kinase n=1 Tax=Stenotrophomonas chelatiphaga TaxID=517011 RepID=A0A0R0DBC3_9GAMM|nr:sensor histidine kinase [Stenotrophomonas chelatiphaga]KRG74376.1 histidine kinase [Stenotrophomonas chelatiphaga]MCS4229993.1 two-component system sensor histidine kinase TctE [Stenotrophomonas chelatiphaga]ROQ45784.1 two-component system sensor histidine kinase TctE [Stenotrophomonas maltophilia]